MLRLYRLLLGFVFIVPAWGAEARWPVLQSHMPAAYPERALERAIEGDVLLQITVSEEGSVVDVTILEEAGHGFDAPAVEAAWTMRFEPALDDRGKPTVAQIQYRYPYRMDQVLPLSAEGVVREQGAKKVIANAVVKAVGPDEVLARTRSDENGRFRFAGLGPGKWVLTVTGPGLTTSSSSIDVPTEGYADNVVLSAERIPDWEHVEVDEYVEVVANLSADPAERELSHDVVVTLPGSLGDPVRALQNLPGVARAPFGSGQLMIRGTDPEDTAYLIDGTRIPIAFHFTAVSTVVAADLLSSVEFMPGNWGVRYGRAIGGVVNLETNDDLPRKSETSLSADIFQATGFTRQRLGKLSTLSMSARRSYIDTIAQPLLAGRGASELRVPRYYDAQVHFVRHLNGNGRATGTLLISDDRFRLLGSTGADAVSYRTGFQKGFLRWVQPTGRGWHTESSFSGGPETQELVLADSRGDVASAIGLPLDLFGDLPTEGSVLEEAVPRWGLRHEWHRDPGDDIFGARVGVDWTWGKQNLQYTVGKPTTAYVGISMPATYVEPTVRLGPVDVIGGVRWEVIDADNALPDSVLDPRVRVVADFGTTRLLGGAGLFSQPAAMRELLAEEGPSLTLERARHLSLGAEQDLGPDARVGIAIYQHDFWNLVIGRDDLFRFDRTALVPGDNFIPFVNTGIGRSFGAELHATWTTEVRILWLSLSLSRATRRDLPTEEWHPATADQPVNLTVIASQALGKWRLGGRARYATGPALTPVISTIYATDLQTWVPLYGEPYSDRAPAFFALDLRIDREWWFRRWKMSIYTEVQNATNHRNIEIPAWNEDYSRLAPVTGLPILPVLGLKATW